MESKTNLQDYFSRIEKTEHEKTIEKLEEPYKSLLEDIGLLLDTNLRIKENEDIRGTTKDSFEKLSLTNNGEYINCILSVYKIKDAKHYISMAKKIAKFFNEEFPYEEKDLNIGLPIRNELMKGYELKDDKKNTIYSAGIYLSNDLSEIRFTFFKRNILE